MVWMLDQGKPLEEAVRFGIACGTAATINKGTQLFKRDDAFRFYEWMKRPTI
jgi:6-phosphofructokinase 2